MCQIITKQLSEVAWISNENSAKYLKNREVVNLTPLCLLGLITSVSKSCVSCTDESSKDETVLSADWEKKNIYINIIHYDIYNRVDKNN